MKQYFLGIDGGGTKTKVFIIDEQKTEIYQGVSGPSTVDFENPEKSILAINEALDNFKQKITFTAIFAGLGGIQTTDEEVEFAKYMVNIKGVSKQTFLYARNDSYNALATSLSFDEGISLISGTGMNCFGIDKTGQYHFAGGLGFKEGDLGSAFSLGFLSMRSLARALDGRIAQTAFHSDLMAASNVYTSAEIKTFFETFTKNRTNIASLAYLTNKHAESGDCEAIRICQLAISELVLCVKAVLSKIKLDNKILTIVGGLGNSKGYFRSELITKLLALDPNLKIMAPKIDPGLAAAYLAQHYFERKK